MYLCAKYGFAMIVVIGAISICSPSARRLQAAQAERDAVAYFKLENVAGGFMTSEDFKGKVTVVDLWATWCTPCVTEIPIYNQLYDAFRGKDVAIVGIAVDSPRRDIPSKVRQLGIKYPVLIANAATGQAFGGIRGFPTTVVISKEGKIYKRYMGSVARKEERIKQDIEHLLGGDSPLPPQKVTPRSLSFAWPDILLIPQVVRDFPGFDDQMFLGLAFCKRYRDSFC